MPALERQEFLQVFTFTMILNNFTTPFWLFPDKYKTERRQ